MKIIRVGKKFDVIEGVTTLLKNVDLNSARQYMAEKTNDSELLEMVKTNEYDNGIYAIDGEIADTEIWHTKINKK